MLLALDTANKQCAVCLYDPGLNQPRAMRVDDIGRGHAERLLPLILEVMGEAFPLDAQPAWDKITKIAVSIGPGSFTGLRVGVSVARAMGLSQNIPTIGISGFEAILASYIASTKEMAQKICIAQDARRGEIFFQYFNTPLDALKPASEPKALSIEGFVEELNKTDAQLTIIGSACEILQQHKLSPNITLMEHNGEIDIKFLAQLAAIKPHTDKRPKPLYIRAADAKPQSPLLHLAPKPSIAKPI